MTKKIWGTLVHFGTNFWYEEGNRSAQDENKLWKSPPSSEIRFDRDVWNEYLVHIKENGINTIFSRYW